MKALVLVAALVALTGCATVSGYSEMVDKWVGMSETDLVRQWGPPAQAYDSGGRRFLQYVESRNVSMPGVAPSYTATRVGNQAYITPTGGIDPWTANLSCKTNFEIDKGRIVAVGFSGNGCKA